MPDQFAIYRGQSGTGTRFYQTASGFLCDYHSTLAPYTCIHMSLILYNISV